MLTASAAPCLRTVPLLDATGARASLALATVASGVLNEGNVVTSASNATVALPPCNGMMAVTMANPKPVEAAESLPAGSAR